MLVGSSKADESDDDEAHVTSRDYAVPDDPVEIFDGTHFPVPELDDESDDGGIAWEEVGQEPDDAPPLRKDGALEIVIEKGPHANSLVKTASSGDSARRPPPTPAERAARQDLHKSHVLALLAHGRHRNDQLNDEILQARLMSKTPLPLQDAFLAFSRKTHPNERDRSRLFDNAMKRLTAWWWSEFSIDQGLPSLKTRAYSDIARELVREGVFNLEDLLSVLSNDGNEKDQDVVPIQAFGPTEVIRSSQSLMKRCVQMKGSRDVGPQLFTSLCRALGIPARLVFSLQPIDWRATAAAADSSARPLKKRKKETPSKQPKSKGKERASTTEDDGEADETDDEGDFEEVIAGSSSRPISVASDTRSRASSRPISVHSTGDESDVSLVQGGPPVKLRRSKPPKQRSQSPDAASMAIQPVFWTEVYSRAMKEWIPVDVTRKAFRCRGLMEPPKANPHNKMLYVVAYEEDGFLRDVTPRYVKQFGASTVKNRVPAKKGDDWWTSAIEPLKRPYTLDRDAKEDAELLRAQINETMPTAVGGFKDHPLYVLERHIKREEVIHPRKKLGLFRNEEVFPRSAVITCRSAEQWMREGRKIRQGEQPLKLVKQRAVTLGKVRAQEAAAAEGDDPVQQGLYAESQTELAQSAPVVNGKVPRNAYGNLDLFASHMVPQGGKHLPYKGIAKVAKKLGVDFAEAITGFEFHKRRAIPVASGIVVPEEEADAVLEAFWQSEHAAAEREAQKIEERALKRWKLLFKGLRLRDRLQADYKSETSAPGTPVSIDGNNELADLAVAREEAGVVIDAKHSAPSAPAKLSNTLRSLEKGHTGASKRRALPTGSGAATLSSDEDVDHGLSEGDGQADDRKGRASKLMKPQRNKRRRTPSEEPEVPPKRSSRITRRRAKSDDDEPIATSRPRRQATKAVSYKEPRQMISEDED